MSAGAKNKNTGAGVGAARSSAVDLIKILGCFFVISLHSNPGNLTYLTTAAPRDFFFSIFLLGVPLFLVQAGFFLFREKNPIRRYRKFLVGLMFPTVIVMLGLIRIEPWTFGRASLSAVLFDIRRETLREFLYALSHWNSESLPDSVIHLWYMAEYGLCVLVAPVITPVCNENKWCVFLRRGIMVLLLAVTLSTDYIYYAGRMLMNGFPLAVSNSYLYLLAGYEIYQAKDRLMRRSGWTAVIAVGVFALCTAVRSLILIPNADNSARFMDYNSVCSLLQACALCCLCIGCVKGESKLLSRIGSRTFAMYLIHLCLVQKTISRGVAEQIHQIILAGGMPAAIGETIYVFAVPVLMFVLIYLAAEGILLIHEIVWKNVVKVWKGARTR